MGMGLEGSQYHTLTYFFRQKTVSGYLTEGCFFYFSFYWRMIQSGVVPRKRKNGIINVLLFLSLQELRGINRSVVKPDLVVEVGAGSDTGIAGIGDDLAFMDDLSNMD